MFKQWTFQSYQVVKLSHRLSTCERPKRVIKNLHGTIKNKLLINLTLIISAQKQDKQLYNFFRAARTGRIRRTDPPITLSNKIARYYRTLAEHADNIKKKKAIGHTKNPAPTSSPVLIRHTTLIYSAA